MRVTARPTCSGCGKPLVWGILPDGRRVPLDALAPCYLVVGATPYGSRVRRAKPPHGPPAYVSHFVTCPERERFKRP